MSIILSITIMDTLDMGVQVSVTDDLKNVGLFPDTVMLY